MAEYLIINKNDNVAIALKDLQKGAEMCSVLLKESISRGHKFALKEIKKGENVVKYGYPIGHATKNILPGEHVHSHNIETNLGGELEYKYDPNLRELESVEKPIQVKVFKRKFGKVGIRNNLMIVPTVGCINSQAIAIKNAVEKFVDHKYVDSVIVATHPFGCSQLGDDHLNTVKILQSLVRHPNNGGVLVLGLGCENNQMSAFKESLGEYDSDRVKFLISQEVQDEVQSGIELCKELYENMKKDVRVDAPISEISIGLKCGGSDGLSGITANPLIGRISDYFVQNNASTVLSEVPEMFGAEQILMERAKDKKTFEKVVKLINNFKAYYTAHNQVCYENPSPGNKAGGITTLEDKSLGCVQKAGTSNVNDVLNCGDEIVSKGLNLLNGPGNDMIACTNLVSVGTHLILFSTGRGTPFGTVVPTVKVSTNSALATNKANWIDFNAGQIVDGVQFETITKDFVEYLIKVINGESKTRNEINGFEEISIFKDGVTL